MAEVGTVSMVGGNDSTEKMIHREIPRVLVLRSLATTRCSEHCSGELSVDNAFALIEGHPNSSSGFTSGPPACQLLCWQKLNLVKGSCARKNNKVVLMFGRRFWEL